MDKSCNTSGEGDSTATSASSSSSSNRDMYLKHLNKISHKISKPIRKPNLFDNQNLPLPQTQHAPPPPPPPPISSVAGPQNLQPQQQPPVYNINKSDFRDVVQKLTGSPAHERIATPPPIQQPKAASSRLQRIRPPPLAQISNRPPPFLNASNVSNNAVTGGGIGGGGFVGGQRPVQAQPLSPLPPFPAVHAAAESPISAYMRFLQNSIAYGSTDSDTKRFSTGLSPLAPRWNNFGPPTQQPLFPPPQPFPLPHQQNIPPPPTASSSVLPPFPAFPSSPLPFGCLPSPKSPYGLLSPGLLLSPSRQLGFQQLPLSPTVPLSSPKWKGI